MTHVHLFVRDLLPSHYAEGFYIISSIARRTTAAGRNFLSATLSDESGTVNLICWDYGGPLSSGDDGKIVYASGSVSEFKGSLQVNADTLRPANEQDEFDISVLVPVAPIDVQKVMESIENLVDSMEDTDYKAICKEFLRRHGEAFQRIPAAKSVHHGFLHGLLMHTGNMLRSADFLSRLYGDVVDRDLLLTGTLLHDFSKREEFTLSAVGLVSDYSVKGSLLGHLYMAAQEAAEVCKELHVPEEKSVLLQHLLLSHHGKPEFGAAVIPQCAEAELLSMIDNLDARMEIYRETMAETPLNAFSGRVFALDGHRIYHHGDASQGPCK